MISKTADLCYLIEISRYSYSIVLEDIIIIKRKICAATVEK